MGGPGFALETGGAAAGGRGALTFGLSGGRLGTLEVGWSENSVSGAAAEGGGGGGSPRSIESSLLVSRSIARTASHDDNDPTSTVRLSASGEPAANNWISGRLAAWPAAVEISVTR